MLAEISLALKNRLQGREKFALSVRFQDVETGYKCENYRRILLTLNGNPSQKVAMRPYFSQRPYLFFLLLALVSAAGWAGQNPAPPEVQKRATSNPYTGDLTIFDSPGRDQRLQIGRVMDILEITPGKNVADIGAGSGWFTVRAARRVAPAGTVYAVDINPDAIRYIDHRVKNESLSNVKTILSKAADPLLPQNALDAVLLLKTYHEVADPVALLERLRHSLRPGAKLGIIDRNGNGTDHGVSRKIVVQEAEQAGYHLLQDYDFVKPDGMDYFLVFTQR